MVVALEDAHHSWSGNPSFGAMQEDRLHNNCYSMHAGHSGLGIFEHSLCVVGVLHRIPSTR